MAYLQSSIREATSMNKKQLVQALSPSMDHLLEFYQDQEQSEYDLSTTVAELEAKSRDELVALWLEVYGVKELTTN